MKSGEQVRGRETPAVVGPCCAEDVERPPTIIGHAASILAHASVASRDHETMTAPVLGPTR